MSLSAKIKWEIGGDGAACRVLIRSFIIVCVFTKMMRQMNWEDAGNTLVYAVRLPTASCNATRPIVFQSSAKTFACICWGCQVGLKTWRDITVDFSSLFIFKPHITWATPPFSPQPSDLFDKNKNAGPLFHIQQINWNENGNVQMR